MHYNTCFQEAITFRTEESRYETSDRNTYYERMVRCYAGMTDGRIQMFLISRAYNPNQVFVYSQNLMDGTVYLENLSIDVSIVHERYNFGSVEI